MIELGTTTFFISGPLMSRREFESYSTQLFEEWDARLAQDLRLPDYSLRLEVEEGSVEGAATVGAALAALYFGIGNYGSFISGLETIRKQVRSAGDFLADQAAVPFTRLNLKPRVTRRSGALGQLQRLFGKVQRRELSVEDAMREAATVLGNDARDAPEFMLHLHEALVRVRINPEQLALPMELPDEVPVDKTQERKRSGSGSRPDASAAPGQQLRVEVWRDSRTGKRQIRITEL